MRYDIKHKSNRIVASIEARMGSSRLPGKVLADIQGQPALTRLLHRLQQVPGLTDIILATTSSAQDDVLVNWAMQQGIAVYRGSNDDVLDRVVKAQQQMQADIVVEVTGDCPLLDPEIISLGIETFLNNDCHVVTNCYKGTYPMGIDVQVFALQDLIWVAQNIHDAAVREHVSLYFYENPAKYKIFHLPAPLSLQMPQLRCQLDYPEDLNFIRRVYKELETKYGAYFGVGEIINLVRREPSIFKINSHCQERATR